MSRLIAVFIALLFLALAFESEMAFSEEGRHSVGFQAGQVGLTNDVGLVYGNALGWGLFFDYAASDWLEFELDYLNSKHSSNSLSLAQSTYEAAVLYNVDQIDVFIPYIKCGAEFVGHTQDLVSSGGIKSYEANAFGLDLGFGGKILLGKSFMSGVDFAYHGIFDASVTPAGAATTKAAQSYFTVMLRLGFVFGSAK